MSFKIVRNDITKMNVDVIVNTANEQPQYSEGVDTAIYKAAGEEQLLAKRREIGYMQEGEVAITSGFNLLAKYIIHAVSPRYIDDNHGEDEKLRNCYRKSLELACKNNCKSIAFPLISTGSYGYPKEEAIRIAVDEINAFLLKNDMLIYLVVFDKISTKLGLSLYPNLEEYIDHNYVQEKRNEEYGENSSRFVKRNFSRLKQENAITRDYASDDICKSNEESVSELYERNIHEVSDEVVDELCKSNTFALNEETICDTYEKNIFEPIQEDICESCASMDATAYEDFLVENETALKERMKHISDTFQQYLFYLIESKGLTNAEVYKRAIITKQLFSKIKLNTDYHPDKSTAMRLCIGAKLNIDETKDLLGRAGYALSPCDKRDIIFSFFIENNIYDMIEIDIALEEYELPCFIK